jgi:hypothetical protein
VIVLSPDDALRRDAEQYAKDVGVTVDEAMKRLVYQDGIGELNAALQANEADTYAGLWIEHQPEFRVIVLFTRRGERTIRPYIAEVPWADLVEVRDANVTLAELETIRAQAARELDKLDYEVHHALDVKGNRVEVWVTDREWFEGELRAAGIRLPKHVALVVVEGPGVRDFDVCAPSPVPGVSFPRQEPVEGIRATMEAELIGDLVLVDGCLRVNAIHGDTSYLPVWPPEYTLQAVGDEIQVLDGEGQVVARVGQEVYMGGGEGSAAAMPDCVREQLPAGCTGPYWIVGTGVRPNLRRDSELFSLDVISTTERSLLFLRKKPVLDDWAEEDGLLTGKLEGGKIPVSWDSERYRQLYYELPGDCNGPYWIVEPAAPVAVPTVAPTLPIAAVTAVAPETYVDPELGFQLTFVPSWHLEVSPGAALNDGSGKTVVLEKDGYQFKLRIQNRPQVVGRCRGSLPEDTHSSFWGYTLGDLQVWRVKAEEGLVYGYHDDQIAFISIISPVDDDTYTCSLETHGQVLSIDYMLPVSVKDLEAGRFRPDILAEMDYILCSITLRETKSDEASFRQLILDRFEE